MDESSSEKDLSFIKSIISDIVDRIVLSKEVIVENGVISFCCPHCFDYVIVKQNEINCKIFRHGEMKIGGTQIPPHLPKEQCDMLFEKGLIYGCGKPFRMDGKNVEICEYI